jgi:ubiquinone/menaquinone biosynthesis C-methylase UbiE
MADHKTDFAGKLGGEEYDLFNLSAPHIPAMETEVGKMVARHMRLKSGCAKVFDIGVGTGDTSHAVLAALGNVEVTAIDIEPQMIDAAKTRFAGESRITLVLSDALSVLQKTESDSVDAVVSGFCLHNLPSKLREEIAREIFRVLKPGGIFVTCDKIAENDKQAHVEGLTKQILAFDVYLPMDRADYREEWIRHYLADDQPGIRVTESEWDLILFKCGFRYIRFSDRTLMDVILWAQKKYKLIQ